MMPGISARPSASIVSRASPSTFPTAAIFPCSMASAPRAGGEPSPSRMSALRITRSYIRAEYTGRRMQLFDLKNQIAVITGGASGIGAATVALFEQCGAKVTVLDIADGVDVTDPLTVDAAFSKLGAFDILVNSAGRAVRKPATELTSDEWDQVLDLNLKATFFCSRAA